MPIVRLSPNLRRFVPELIEPTVSVGGATVAEALRALAAAHPRLLDYLVDETGALRRHVNVFVGDAQVQDRATLSDPIDDADKLFLVGALSGGLR